MYQAGLAPRKLPTAPTQQPNAVQPTNLHNEPSNPNNLTVERSRAESRALPLIPTVAPSRQELLTNGGTAPIIHSEPLQANNSLVSGLLANPNTEAVVWIPFLPGPSWLASTQPNPTIQSGSSSISETTNELNRLSQPRQNLANLSNTELLGLFRQCQTSQEFCNLCGDVLRTKQFMNLDKQFIEGLLRIFPRCETSDVVHKLSDVVFHLSQCVKLDEPVSVELLKIFPLCHTDETVGTLCEFVHHAMRSDGLDAQHHIIYKLEEMACGYVMSGNVNLANIVFSKLNTELPNEFHVHDFATNHQSNFEKSFHLYLKLVYSRGGANENELDSRILGFREMARQFLSVERPAYASIIYFQLMARGIIAKNDKEGLIFLKQENGKETKESTLSISSKTKIETANTNNNSTLVENQQNAILPPRPRNSTPGSQQLLSLCVTEEDVDHKCSFFLKLARQQESAEKQYIVLCELEKAACQWMLSSNKQHFAEIVFARLSNYLGSEQLVQSVVNKCEEGFRLNCGTILGKAKTTLPENALSVLALEFKQTAQEFVTLGRPEYAQIIYQQLVSYGFI